MPRGRYELPRLLTLYRAQYSSAFIEGKRIVDPIAPRPTQPAHPNALHRDSSRWS